MPNPDAEAHVHLDVAAAIAASDPVPWAASMLVKELTARGLRVVQAAGPAAQGQVAIRLVPSTTAAPAGSGVSTESFTLSCPGGGESGDILVNATDARGAAYGLLELADRVRYADDAMLELRRTAPSSHAPATPVRGILRALVSDATDLAWFHDPSFWTAYLDELALQRINRIHLAFGMQYNYSHDTDGADNYLCFAYPFLVDVPGFHVRVEGLADGDRARNMESLRGIGQKVKQRGMHFQLGLWNHAFDPGHSTPPRYVVSGLEPARHAEYCATALAQLLRQCPSVDGVTFRVHYESGIPEEHQRSFWSRVLSAVRSVDRRVEIDLHGKGLDQDLIDIALATGAPVVISPKYWAEHQGLPYHQASIRDAEKSTAKALHARPFTRYGYADFLREDRAYDVMFRIWPGTQRLLLWGDPILAAGYGSSATLAGAVGVEICEPLTFKGRKNSGEHEPRDPYVDTGLKLGSGTWRKYLYTYRLWGQLLYDPDVPPDTWRRYLRHEFGAASASVERALSYASRILPLVTVSHGVSASNNHYWPEMYVTMPIVEGDTSGCYPDAAEPRTFGGVSPLDPALFASVNDHADDLVAGVLTERYTPIDTAEWLEQLADEAERNLAQATASYGSSDAPTFRRTAIDVRVQAELGRFFARRARAGVHYALYERTNAVAHLDYAIQNYERAREAFASVAAITSGVYSADVTFGNRPSERGHWADRLPAIDSDLAAMRHKRRTAQPPGRAAREPLSIPRRPACPGISHQAPRSFIRGLPVDLAVESTDGRAASVSLHYRHLNQAEDYRVQELSRDGKRFTGSIPAAYTNSRYPLIYFFVVTGSTGDRWVAPGLDNTLSNQPYHVVREAR